MRPNYGLLFLMGVFNALVLYLFVTGKLVARQGIEDTIQAAIQSAYEEFR